MIKIQLNGDEKHFEKKVPVMDLLPPQSEGIFACKVNNRMRELTYTIEEDATLEFLGLENYDTVRLYDSSLRYLLTMALYRLDKKSKVEFSQFVSQSLLCSFSNTSLPIDANFLTILEKEMLDIVAANYPIVRKTVPLEEAMDWFEKHGHEDKKEITQYRPESTTHFYECNGYSNYMFGYMVPSTGYLKQFKLRLYFPHIVLQFPRSEHVGQIPDFIDSPKLCKTLLAAKEWAETIKASSIADINHYALSKDLNDFINVCETKHNDMLAELGQLIKQQIHTIRLITIAGPSSSGKTTFSHRLRIELLSKGIRPLMISIDDYYKNKVDSPRDADGKPDYETIEALDIKLFNTHILELIQGRSVTLPHFNFKTGLREQGPTVQLTPNTPIIIEGIHALNEQLTSFIPKYQKFKIYISPLPQLHLDQHNPISLTDLRLVRRIVRDFKYRNTGASETLAMWQSVRRGEYKWIYPYQEEADYVFNSEFAYEVGVLKKYALPLLEAIPSTSEYFVAANRIIKFIKYAKDIPDDRIPSNSLIREFIGGSCFY